MVVGEIAVLDSLRDERPQFESFVSSLEIEDYIERAHKALLLDEKYTAEEFFGDREGSHPDVSRPGLAKNPFKHVRHLERVTQIRLVAVGTQRQKDVC